MFFWFTSIPSAGLATIAATYASGGVCPVTRDQVISPEHAKNTLQVMYNCGMYDYRYDEVLVAMVAPVSLRNVAVAGLLLRLASPPRCAPILLSYLSSLSVLFLHSSSSLAKHHCRVGCPALYSYLSLVGLVSPSGRHPSIGTATPSVDCGLLSN
jgi:hypothetical protein